MAVLYVWLGERLSLGPFFWMRQFGRVFIVIGRIMSPMQWLLTKIFCSLFTISLLTGFTASDMVTHTYTLQDGTQWVAEVGQVVTVHMLEKEQELQYTGKVLKLASLYILLNEEMYYPRKFERVEIYSLVDGKKHNRGSPAGSTELRSDIKNRHKATLVLDKAKKDVAGQYVIVKLVGEAGMVPLGSDGAYSTDFIAAKSIDEMLDFFHKIKMKKIKHVVFVVESSGGDPLELEKIQKVLKKYKNFFEYYLVVDAKDVDPLGIAKLCESVTVCTAYMQGDYEEATLKYENAFWRLFWKELLATSFAFNVETALKETVENFTEEKVYAPSDIGELNNIDGWEENTTRSKNFDNRLQREQKEIVKVMMKEWKVLQGLSSRWKSILYNLKSVDSWQRRAEESDPGKLEVTYDIITTPMKLPDGTWVDRESKVESQAYKYAWCQEAEKSIGYWEQLIQIATPVEYGWARACKTFWNQCEEEILTATQLHVRTAFIEEWKILASAIEPLIMEAQLQLDRANTMRDYLVRQCANRNCQRCR